MNSMTGTDRNALLNQHWRDHTKQPELVVQRLEQQLEDKMDDAQLMGTAALAAHVYGEHLGNWQAGRRFLASLAQAHPDASALTLSRLNRQRAVLARAEDPRAVADGFDQWDRLYVTVLALPAVTLQRSAEDGEGLLVDALQQVARADDASARRLLAVTAANLVCDLLDRSSLSASETDFLIRLAETSHVLWQRDGDAGDREKSDFRLLESYQRRRKPRDYDSGRYPRQHWIEP
jgi:hypothetical protein